MTSTNAPAVAAPVVSRRVEINGPWIVSTATATQYPDFVTWRIIERLANLHAPGLMPDFSGTIRCETTFSGGSGGAVILDLGAVFEIAVVTLNGKALPTRISPPYVYDVSEVVRQGENHLVVEVTNTLVNQQLDWFSQFHHLEPTGLLGPVTLGYGT